MAWMSTSRMYHLLLVVLDFVADCDSELVLGDCSFVILYLAFQDQTQTFHSKLLALMQGPLLLVHLMFQQYFDRISSFLSFRAERLLLAISRER